MPAGRSTRFHTVAGDGAPATLYRQESSDGFSTWHELHHQTGRWKLMSGRPSTGGPTAPHEVTEAEAQQLLSYWVTIRMVPGGGRLHDAATANPTGPTPMRDRLGWLIFAAALLAVFVVGAYRAVAS